MSDTTPRHALPLIAPGQAQKELFHNEALARIDIALNGAARSLGDPAPPADRTPGDCWIVGATPAGEWAGRAGQVAGWTEGGWRFVAPLPGMALWVASAGLSARWDGAGWRLGEIAAARVTVDGVGVVGAQQPAINPPAGGAIVDAEARDVLARVLTALRTHGLIAS